MAPSLAYGNILWLECTDSTNAELRRRMASLDNLSIVAAKSQTQGRGQGDHSWISAPGENLTFSIALKFDGLDIPVRDAAIINDILCPSIQEFLSEEGVTSRVKQPNDIWVGDRKICGILIENILKGNNLDFTIAGIGLNLNQTKWPAGLPNPVSLRELTGKRYPPEECLERISALCKKNWEKFRPGATRQ